MRFWRRKGGDGPLAVDYSAPRSKPVRASSPRDMIVLLRVGWVNLVGAAGTFVALLPLADRRRPIGTRRALTRPDAPVIPIATGRRAQSR